VKIARGMFESSNLAEYLYRNPHEARPFLDFGAILNWRKYQGSLKFTPTAVAQFLDPESVNEYEAQYNAVKAQFTTAKGRVRDHWTQKSNKTIAEEVDRAGQYELIYGLASSIHHANAEGLMAHLNTDDAGTTYLSAGPSMAWTGEALSWAHMCIWLSLETLDKTCNLGFDTEVNSLGKQFIAVWQK
jgi:Family of unknown function (DUF5677)